MKYILPIHILLTLMVMSCSEKKAVDEKNPILSDEKKLKAEAEGVIIAKQISEDTLKGSLKAYAKGMIGTAEFKITYHSPAVRGRIVWGGLVPYNKVWVTGAHMATTFESNVDFHVGDKAIAAGKYGVFTIPGKDKWVVIINSNWQQHLTDEYDSKEDITRLEVTPLLLPDKQERLQYEVLTTSGREGVIQVSWDKVQIQIPISI